VGIALPPAEVAAGVAPRAVAGARPAGRRADYAALLARSALALMVALYALGAGAAALRRHHNLQSQALDMGYADQIAWNMSRGRPFRFTVFRGQVGAESGRPLSFGPGADRDSLLAFHAELLFAPLGLLYRLWPGPETLIVLLTAVLALGAVPAYLLAHRLLDHRAAGLAFAAAYLLFPSVQAANLADFHLVSMAPAFLLWALAFLVTGRRRAFVVAGVASALLKEEVGLLVAMLGLYAWLAPRATALGPPVLRDGRGAGRLGLTTAAVAAGWVAACFLVIIPHFDGGAPSLFAVRYGDAVAHLRRVPGEWLAGRPDWPVPAYTVAYARELLGSVGFLALLAPVELLVSAPALAVNGLSDSAWQHGGGAHYSAEAVPGLLFAAAVAARRLAHLGRRRLGLPAARCALALSLVALGGGLAQAWRHGVLPPSRRFAAHADALWAPNGRLERLRPLLARIPEDAPVSAQSNVFPHLSRRERVYVFPAIEDARYVLVDVAGTSDPLSVDELLPEVSALLVSARFRLLDGVDGFLLFERREDARPGLGAGTALPARFLDFARDGRDGEAAPAPRAVARFGAQLEVVGYRLTPVPEVSFGIRRAVPEVRLRALAPLERAYRVTTFRVGRDGLARIHDDGNPTQLWHPTSRWRAGEVLRLEYPPLTYAPGERLGIGVQLGTEPDAPRLGATSETLAVVDGGAVVVLGALP
jgi:uncharacterized membrane protein